MIFKTHRGKSNRNVARKHLIGLAKHLLTANLPINTDLDVNLNNTTTLKVRSNLLLYLDLRLGLSEWTRLSIITLLLIR